MGLVVDTEQSRDKNRLSAKDQNFVWYKAAKGRDTAMAVQAWMDSLERVNWSRRWQNLVYYRYMTGRAAGPVSYNFSSTARPSSAKVYGRARFDPPRHNELMRCSDALANRVYKAQPFLQVCPINGDSTTRFQAKYLSKFMDACFYDLDLWRMVETCGYDCRTWGDGFVKIDASMDGKSISAVRLIADEVMVDDNQCNAGEIPRDFGIRLFVSREELMAAFGTNPEAIRAIQNAPKSNNGFYFGEDIDYTDIVVLREAWHCQRNKGKGSDLNKGRHVLSVGTYCFTDEEYDRPKPPIARLVFKPAQTGYFSRGMPEMALGLQRELDRVMAANWENMRRAAWPRIGLFAGSNVDPAKLGDRSNGIYTVTGGQAMAPKFDFPQAMPTYMFNYIQQTKSDIRDMFRLSEHSITGQDLKLTSGVAKTKQNEIDDAAHIDLSLHLESFVEQIGSLILLAAEKVHPKVTLPGRNAQLINWNDLKWSESSFFLRSFPVGRLSQSIAVRQQQIDTWHAEGAISRETKLRLEQVPDTDGYMNLANAAQDYVEWQLDNMIEHNRFEPPEPWMDLQSALAASQSRYLFEKRLGTPEDRTDKILLYLAMLDEMVTGAEAGMKGDKEAPAPAGPDAGAPPPGFGIAPPSGAAPAPAPFPQAPGMAPPQQV